MKPATPNTTAKIGRNIRRIRLARKLTQAALAERADVTVTWLCGLERGNRGVSLATLYALAKGLRVPVAELIG